MTTKEKIRIHVQIEAENKRKLKEWKESQMRSVYTIEYRDGNGIWKLGAYRVGYGRIKARMLESVYRMGGFQTRVTKETLAY